MIKLNNYISGKRKQNYPGYIFLYDKILFSIYKRRKCKVEKKNIFTQSF